MEALTEPWKPYRSLGELQEKPLELPELAD